MRSLRTLGRVKPLGFHRIAMALTLAAASGLWGCGGGSTSSPAPAPASLINVTVTPNSVTVLRDATQAFTAKVTGTTNTAVTWSVEEGSGGTIDSAGVYSPPQNGAGAFHVIATSQANSAAAGAAVIAVPMPQITINPVAVTLRPDGTRTFAATVSGLTNKAVNFTIQESAGGLINSTGLYTAPTASGFYHVVATSSDETTVTANATVTVTTSPSGFTATGSLNVARGLQTATLLPPSDNKVLVAYGSNSSSYTDATGYVGLSSIEVYDAGTGTFTEIVGDSGAGIYGHTATLLQNGNVLLAGGFLNSVWDYGPSVSGNGAGLYDSATGVFSGTGNMTANRGDHTATLLADGKVLIAGGADQGVTGTGLASAELYDPGTGTFTQTGSMAVGRFLHTATLLQNGKVLIVGGALTSTSDPVATAELYDPATGIFTMTGAMATAREQHTATLLADGRVLIVGGTTTTGTSAPTATVEVYDPSTGLFSITGSMAEARILHTATLLPSGKVLVAGGGGENSTAEVYDPATGSFSITGGMEIGRSGHTATLLPNGSVLVAGGGVFAGLVSAELYQ